jgi:predicted transcriptional regulator
MRALLDQKDVVRLLRLEVNRAGSQKKWAKKNGVTQSLISMVLSGDRPPNYKIISALKLRRVVVYERLDRTAGRPSVPTRAVGSPTGRGLP